MIRPATLSDLAAIVGIYNEAVADRFATADSSPVTVEQRRPWFDEHDDEYPIWVLEAEGSIRGWYSLSSYRAGRPAVRGTAELSYYVAADSRGRARARAESAADAYIGRSVSLTGQGPRSAESGRRHHLQPDRR